MKLDEAARQVGRSLSTVQLKDLKGKFQKILEKSKSRVVVLVDDIDRLDPREIQAVFKLVKLSADFEKISYVLAFDDDVVAKALGGKVRLRQPSVGREFLEKIIQVPLHLPPVSRSALRKLAFEGIDAVLSEQGIELTKDDEQDFTQAFVRGLESRLKTPRQAKRFSNALAFCMPLLKGEVHPVDQMLIEGIRIFYPELYETIRSNPDVFSGPLASREREGWKKHCAEIIEGSLGGLDQAVTKALLQGLFPRLKGVFGNTHYDSEWDERWTKQQRICSNRYFARYFQYAIPSGDIPDAGVSELLVLAESSVEASIEKIREYASHGATPTLIEKLRLIERTIGISAASNLAKSIAQIGNVFPKEQKMFSTATSTWGQATILVANLVTLAPPGTERERLARELVQIGDSIPFAAQIFFWLRLDRGESGRIVSSECELEMGQILAGRVALSAADKPPYSQWPDEAYIIFGLWKEFDQDQQLTRYLEDRLSKHPKETTDLLGCYAPRSLSLTSGSWHDGQLRQQGYSAIAELVSPDFVMKQLRSLYGADLDNPVFHASEPRSVAEALAHQFAFLHLRGNQS